MAVVGEAHIVVRALTNNVAADIRRGFNGGENIGRKAGESLGDAFKRGFGNKVNANIFTRFSDALNTIAPKAEEVSTSFHNLMRRGFTLGTTFSGIVGGISSVIGALGALVGSAGNAAASLAVIGNGAFAAASAMGVAKLALGGVGRALGLLNKAHAGSAKAATDNAAQQAAAAQRVQQAEQSLARVIETNRDQLTNANNQVRDAQLALNAAIKAGQEELQQLGFDAEDAALAEKRAQLDLQDARDKLAGVQDLPPNNRARQDAELAYQEADLNYRRAKDRTQDLNKEQDRAARTGVAGTQGVIDASKNLKDAEANRVKTVRDGARQEADARQAVVDALKAQAAAQKKANDAAAAGPNPYAGLNAAQIRFVNGLQRLKPLLTTLKATAADAFLPPLLDAINLIANRMFPTLNKGIGEVGRAMGSAVGSIARGLTGVTALANIGALFSSSARIIRILGVAIGNLVAPLTTVLVASAPNAERFANAIEKASERFSRFVDAANKSGALATFFKNAGDTAAQFGRIAANVMGGFSAVMAANTGPGSGGGMLLDSLEKATQNFQNLGDAANKSGLRQYFIDAANNARPIFALLGDIGKAFLRVGANPNIGKAFGILRGAVGPLEHLQNTLVGALPSLAGLVVQIVKITDVLQDTGSVKVFFDTLKTVAGAVLGFVSNPAINNVMTMVSRIAAVVAALVLVSRTGIYVKDVVVGSFAKISKNIGAAIDAPKRFAQQMALMTYSSNPLARGLGRAGSAVVGFGRSIGRAMLGPVGIVIGIIALLVGAFIALYKTNAQFKAQMDAVWKQLQGVFVNALGQIMAAIQPLIPVLTGAATQILTALAPIFPLLAGALGNLITQLVPVVTMIISALVPALASILEAVIPLVTTLITALIPVFTQIIQAILPLVVLLINILVPVLTQLLGAFMPLITTLLGAFLPIFGLIIRAIMPLVTTLLGVLMPVLTFLIRALLGVVTFILSMLVPVIKFLVGVIQNVIAFLPQLGTVFANVWGAIVRFVSDAIGTIVNVIRNEINGIRIIWNAVWTGIKNFFALIWRAMVLVYTPIINGIKNYINNLMRGISIIWNAAWRGISSFFGGIWQGIVSTVKGIGGTFRDVFNNVKGFISSAFRGVVGTVKGPINTIIDLVNGAIRGLNKLHVKLPAILGGGTFGISIPTIPKLAAGGIVRPTTGGSIVNVAEAGRAERIEPLDAQGLSVRDRAIIAAMTSDRPAGVTLNLYPPPGANNREIADMVNREIAFQMRKGGY